MSQTPHQQKLNMNMNIPTIEELDRIGCKASGWEAGVYTIAYKAYLTAIRDAIRDAVVAACRPQLRPIAEMPEEVPEGCVRVFRSEHGGWYRYACAVAVHYIDIALPEPNYPADFEQAFAESKLDAKDKDAAFTLWKGGAR